MDFSAIFAGVAAIASVLALVYSVRQHRDNIRKEFILWALERMQSPEQREARGLIWQLHRPENAERRQAILDGIQKGTLEILYGDDLSKIRSCFALCSEIGYFCAKLGYGDLGDVKALFPQVVRLWEVGRPYIYLIRQRPEQKNSFIFFERLAEKLQVMKDVE